MACDVMRVRLHLRQIRVLAVVVDTPEELRVRVESTVSRPRCLHCGRIKAHQQPPPSPTTNRPRLHQPRQLPSPRTPDNMTHQPKPATPNPTFTRRTRFLCTAPSRCHGWR